MNIVEKRMKRWKEKLVDLSKRNRLLNFRPTKVTTIHIVDEIPSEIYKTVAIDNTTMRFLPIALDENEEKDVDQDNSQEKQINDKPKIDASSLEFKTYETSSLEEKYVDKYIQTNLIKKDLLKNLSRIYSKASSVMEEQGYNVLFLGLSFLEWYESESSDVKLRAPIILVPVELVRKSVRGAFKLKYTNEPPIFNPALIQKLKNDFSITLKIDEYSFEETDPQQIFEIVKEAIKNYKRWRITNDIYLSLFSFAKFIMYKDIDKYMSVLLNNPIIQLICGQSTGQNISLDLLVEDKDLDRIITPLETFQILDADSSQQQAILTVKRGQNLVIEGPPGTGKSQTIANIISEFLAENKKVLFVSQKMAALEVVKKRLDNNGLGDFCMELHSRKANKKRVIKELARVLEMQKKPDHSHDDEISKIEKMKNDLNSYVKDIHTPYGKLEMTPYQAFGIINKHQDIQDINFVFKNVKEWDKRKYNTCCDLLNNLASSIIPNPGQHPWYGSQLTTLYYQEKLKLTELMSSIINNYSTIQNYIEILAKYPFFNNPLSITDMETLVDINFLLIRYYRYKRNPLLFFTPSFWRDRRLLKKYMIDKQYEQNLKDALYKLKNKKMSEQIDIESYKSTSYALSKALSKLENDVKLLFKLGKIDESLTFEMEYTKCMSTSLIEKILNMKNSIDSIDNWLRYQNALKECEEMGLRDFVDKVMSLNLPPEKLVNAFECQLLRCWLDAVFSERESLKKFYGEDHKKLIQKFCELDRKQMELAKIRIQHTLSSKFANGYTPSKGSELGIILRESRKSRAHMPIRKLFEQASNVIINLKPCLMMSPLTVAQFLNPELIKFDLIIFDEASQIPPEDSIGSILRGKQIVIAGDSKQLPPTTFFQSYVLTPEDEDDASVETLPEDLDSILDECAVSTILKTMLKWHYRSKHESLIAFSNKRFYDNRLFTFPSAEEECPDLGIKFYYNPNTIYDRGGKGTNIEQAIEIAKAVFKHFRENPDLSLGVGTFSIRQKYAIEDVIVEMLNEDNSLELFFAKDKPEHFFIKNLETIQGDERDVIFISIGYGKDQYGRLSMNFGPINQIGGSRRLNVLITRARKRVEIFSSIRGDDIDLSRTDSEGVTLLKNYLDFAEKGKVMLSYKTDINGFLESPFEESVYNLLVAKGIKVRKQVGCSGYRIDLAVLDDNNPGKYILGIECDGANYHSSTTARDRDRLRQQVLEDLNWNIYRIWSTDWFKNPHIEFEKLLDVIEKTKRGEFFKKKIKINPKYKIEYKKQIYDNNKPQVKNYSIFPIKFNFLPSKYFYQDIESIAAILRRVVEYEGPIHKDEAWRRIVQYWGIRAVGSRIRRILQSVEYHCMSNKMIKKKGKFYWPVHMKKTPVRYRDSKDVRMDIELISPDEIGETAMLVLKSEYSMPRSDLINQTAKLLGFARITENINKYIWESINKYKKCNKILEINGRFTFNTDEKVAIGEEAKTDINEEDITRHEIVKKKVTASSRKDEKNRLKKIERIIKQAIKNHYSITIEYVSASSNYTSRKIEPYKYDGIYIRSFCHLVKENRTFRIDRIIKISTS